MFMVNKNMKEEEKFLSTSPEAYLTVLAHSGLACTGMSFARTN
jgi:hypothetical protein